MKKAKTARVHKGLQVPLMEKAKTARVQKAKTARVHKGLQVPLNKALSDREVLKLVKNKARVLIYEDLADFDTLDEALGEHEAIFLLYEWRKNYGHWTCLFKTRSEGRSEDLIEFFDSYGKFPDTQLKMVPEHFREISGQNYPLLTSLLYYSPYNITYNEHKFQKSGNTCGRWVALRLLLRDLSLADFKRFIDKIIGSTRFGKISNEELVTLLTIDQKKFNKLLFS